MPEYVALKTVHEQVLKRWAIGQAALHNLRAFDAPWIPDDFLVPGLREQRDREARMDRQWVERENMKLSMIRPGGKLPDNIPDWAK